MDSWENGVASKKTFDKSQWEGEDEDDDVQDSWDQELEAEVKQESVKNVNSKRNINKVGDKDEKRKKQDATVPNLNEELSPEEKMIEKLRQQKLQEESDLSLAKEIFGISTLDSKEDFDRFGDEILKKIKECPNDSNYFNFAERICTAICLNLSSSELKKVYNTIGNLHIEKLKLESGDKVKKHKNKMKAKLKVDEETDCNEYSAYTEDFNDFI